jgi:hypothetical protein
MIPQTQSRTGPTGRCFPACLASILEIQENSVPDFMEESDEEFFTAVNQFLARFGLRYKQVPIQDVHPVGWHTVEGLSPRGGQHAVVGRDGRMVWDPHPPDGTGRFLVKPEIYGLLLKTGRAMDTEPRTLHYKCPDCGTKLLGIEGMQSATQVVRRKCRACGEVWQIVVKPVALKQGAGWADIGEFARAKAKDMDVERVPNVGEKIQLPSGKVTKVHKVASATDLFGRPEFHVLTTTGEVLPVTVKEK